MPTTKINGIPVMRAVLADEECGFAKISLVDDPAVESYFDAFDNDKKVTMYYVSDEEERRVLGVVMRADYPIYRYSKKTGEFYILFDRPTIKAIAQKYLRENRQNIVNLMHEDGSDVEGVEMVQWFIKDSAKGIAPAGFDEISDGSLFAEFKIENDEIWDAIKAGTYKGFSVETTMALEPYTEDLDEDVEGLYGKIKKHISNKTNMAKLKKLGIAMAKFLGLFKSVTTDKGVLYWDGDQDAEVGNAVYVDGEDNTKVAAEDGDYKLESGDVYKVSGGKITEIVPAAEPEPESEDNKGTDGEDAGATVEAEKQGFSVVKEAMAKVYEALSATYDEIRRNIASAIACAGYNGWIAEAASDYCVVEVWDELTNCYKYYRFSITTAEDGSITINGGPEEVKPSYVPVSQPASEPAPAEPAASAEEGLSEEQPAASSDVEAKMQALESQLQERDEKIAEMEEQFCKLVEELEKFKKAPAAPHPHDAFSKKTASEVKTVTGKANLDRILGAAD